MSGNCYAYDTEYYPFQESTRSRNSEKNILETILMQNDNESSKKDDGLSR